MEGCGRLAGLQGKRASRLPVCTAKRSAAGGRAGREATGGLLQREPAGVIATRGSEYWGASGVG